MASDADKKKLDEAFDELEKDLPARMAKMLRWLREPKARKFRIPIGILFIIGGFLWFLPVLGLWLLPLGVMVIAQDIPFMRAPVGKGILWLVHEWRRLKDWNKRRKAHVH